MKVIIVAVEQTWTQLQSALLPPGSGDEHFGFAIAGISRSEDVCRLLIRKFILADSSCLVKQSGANVRPDPRFVDYVWTLAKESCSSLIDFHTHPFSDTNVAFSSIDDQSERRSFPRAVEALGEGPHASVVLGRSSLDARWYEAATGEFRTISMVRVLGENLRTIIPTSARQPAALEAACI